MITLLLNAVHISYSLIYLVYSIPMLLKYFKCSVLCQFKCEGDESVKDWMQMPLAAAGKIRNLDAQDVLWEFIKGVTLPSAPDVDLVIKSEKGILNQVLRKCKSPTFDVRSPINVQFHSSGVREPGVDAGGPTRAFFHRLMDELVRGSLNGIRLFEGKMGNLTPSFDYNLVSSCLFVMVGRMILHSVIHKCQGLPGISPAVISYVVSGSRVTVLEHLDVKDIPDPCLRQNLCEVHAN